MGTRHVTAVYLDGEYKVAQYGQWDGYPEGQGITALNFCWGLTDKDVLDQFKKNVKSCSWITPEEEKEINEKIRNKELDDFYDTYPELNRDTGAGILYLILMRGGLKLYDEIDFVADGLFCEWVWLIDLDKGTFEGYEGFQKSPPKEGDRWYFLLDKCGEEYYTPKKVCEYSLDALPTDEEFLNGFHVE